MEILTTVWLAIVAAVSTWQFIFLTSHVALNFVAAVGAALYTRTFKWDKLYRVFGYKLIPFWALYLFGVVVGMLGIPITFLSPEYTPDTVFMLLELALLANLLNSLYNFPLVAKILDALPDGFLETVIDDYKKKLQQKFDTVPKIDGGQSEKKLLA